MNGVWTPPYLWVNGNLALYGTGWALQLAHDGCGPMDISKCEVYGELLVEIFAVAPIWFHGGEWLNVPIVVERKGLQSIAYYFLWEQWVYWYLVLCGNASWSIPPFEGLRFVLDRGCLLNANYGSAVHSKNPALRRGDIYLVQIRSKLYVANSCFSNFWIR